MKIKSEIERCRRICDNASSVFHCSTVRKLIEHIDAQAARIAEIIEVKQLMTEKVEGLKRELWDSKQLVEAKSWSKLELMEEVSTLKSNHIKSNMHMGETIRELEQRAETAEKELAAL
ncbi:hypothetical protein BTJ39_23990, partial [Izhakiella australiensis]